MSNYKIIFIVSLHILVSSVYGQMPEKKYSSGFIADILKRSYEAYNKFNEGSFELQVKYKSGLSFDTSFTESYYIFQRKHEDVSLRLEYPNTGTVKILHGKQVFLIIPADTIFGDDEIAINFRYSDRGSLFPLAFTELPFLDIDFFFKFLEIKNLELDSVSENPHHILKSGGFKVYINKSTYLIEKVVNSTQVPGFDKKVGAGNQYKEINVISQTHDPSLIKPSTFSVDGRTIISSKEYYKKKEQIKPPEQIRPDLQLLHFPSGDSFQLTELKKDIYVLDFWYAGCYPCWRSASVVNEVYESLDTSRIALIGVNVRAKDSNKSIHNYIDKNELNYMNVRISDQRLIESIGVSGYPYFLIMDRNGNILFRHVGLISQSDLEGAIAKAISDFDSISVEGGE